MRPVHLAIIIAIVFGLFGWLIASSTNFGRDASQVARDNKIKGEKFLEENKSKPGVVALSNGLQYIVLKEGHGPRPGIRDRVEVDYHGTLIDGTVFDSSVRRGTPYQTPLTRVIDGWKIILQLMPEGSKWRVFIPAKLGYGAKGSGAIGPNEPLIFDMELLHVFKSELSPG